MVGKTVSAAAALALLVAAGSAFAAGISERQAKREIVGDGYTKVQALHKTTKGWTASALESGKPVTLLVDQRGDVEKTK